MTVTTLSSLQVGIRVMHINLGLPLISTEQDPHLPASQVKFQPTSRIRSLRLFQSETGVKHDLALVDLDDEVAECATAFVAAPNPHPRVLDYLARLPWVFGQLFSCQLRDLKEL